MGSRAGRARRAGKLVATNRRGFLPSTIMKPLWSLLKGVPATLADGKVGWGEVVNKPAGFADGTDDGAFESKVLTGFSVFGAAKFGVSVGSYPRNVVVHAALIPVTEGGRLRFLALDTTRSGADLQ